MDIEDHITKFEKDLKALCEKAIKEEIDHLLIKAITSQLEELYRDRDKNGV